MTTIAWDGKTLAADKMMSDGCFKAIKTKIRKCAVGLLGASGDARYTAAAMDWVECMDKDAPFPRSPDKDETVYVMHVHPDGKLDVYFNCEHPTRVESPYYALGSGRDFALAAMHLGYEAVWAIKVASELDINTGMGVDSFTLEATCE